MFKTFKFAVLIVFTDGTTAALTVSRHGNDREHTADAIADELLAVPDVSMVTVEPASEAA